jgi:ribosome-associated protein
MKVGIECNSPRTAPWAFCCAGADRRQVDAYTIVRDSTECIIDHTAEITDQSQRAAAARKFAIDAARLAATTRCHSVVVLDVSGLSPVTDYFVIATGTSSRQMRTVADEVGELGEKQDFAPFSIGGYEGETWILLDCIDVVVHIFNSEARQYYDLDGLWGDAKRVEWTIAHSASDHP